MVVWLSKKEPEETEISDQMKSTNLGNETVWMDGSKAECHGSTQDVDMVRKRNGRAASDTQCHTNTSQI
ncbi:hypothetical protein N7467_002350 [Penicillium canescens]|nr:hypothetical protein N7467_002350 [Penicillium canescens]